MRTMGIVTTSRADYGLYFPILKEIIGDPQLKLQLYVTGTHLRKEFGYTVSDIRKDGFPISVAIGVLSAKDSPVEIAGAMGTATIKFGKLFEKHRPDILVVLGDRFEMHACAMAAIPFQIPIAHIHGGELTAGSFDEYFRHSLTKISHLHFASTRIYAKRIKQMGEDPWRVNVCGAPGLDNLRVMTKYSKEELEAKFNIDLSRKIILVTFHPVTLETQTQNHISHLLNAIANFKDYNVVFTSPNADTHNQAILRAIKNFVARHQNAFFFTNFGPRAYISMMNLSTVMVGNSSSGIIEAASFKLPVVNIGTRQQGRDRGKNVIDTSYDAKDIRRAIDKAVSDEFRKSLKDLRNPYGDGNAAKRIVRVLKNVELKKLIPKRFCDL